MNRVVVTGLGAVSPIGNNTKEVFDSLQVGRSGIVFMPEMGEAGFKSCVYGPVKGLDTNVVPKKQSQTMSDVAKYGMVAALEALQDAGLAPEALQTERAGIIAGVCGGGVGKITRTERMIEEGISLSRAGANGVVQIMNSTVTANLAALFGVKGRTYSLSSACCTGTDCIGHAYILLKHGQLDLCIGGGAEEDLWKQMGPSFDNTGEMPRSFNDRPTQACRPYDRDREGFALSAGAGMVILETLDHAQKRGAEIYAEIVSYGSTNDGEDMFRPNGEGLKRAICQTLNGTRNLGITTIDYINPHGSGTKVGDDVEVRVIREVFGKEPLISSTKSLTGHSMAATGALEVIYTLLMLDHNFVAATANLEHIAPECEGIRHVSSAREVPLQNVMSFNFGLGGANACLIFRKL